MARTTSTGRTTQSYQPTLAGDLKIHLQPDEAAPKDADREEDQVLGRLGPLLQDEALDAEASADLLEDIFSELHSTFDLCSRLSLQEERNCPLASMLSAIWQPGDEYWHFIAPQASGHQMTPALWAELQRFVQWADLDADEAFSVVCIASGLAGGSGGDCSLGSRFMDEKNGQITVLSLRSLRRLDTESPRTSTGTTFARARGSCMPGYLAWRISASRGSCA